MIEETKTVCYKITEAIKILEHCMETAELDAGSLANIIHEIRQDATRMESGLKLRKEMMIDAGLEEEYKKRKGIENTPTGINKVANGVTQVHPDEQFEITVKNDNEIIYQNKVRAGCMCVAEKITEGFDDGGHITGVTQQFFFGKPLHWWHCFNQLQIGIEGKKFEILTALRNRGIKI